MIRTTNRGSSSGLRARCRWVDRAWMNSQPTYMPPVALGDPMRGIACGTVLDSRHPDLAEGDVVSGLGEWADYQIGTQRR